MNGATLGLRGVVRRASWLALGAFVLCGGSASANGPGEIRVADVPVDGYRVTVATSPSPLVVGEALVTILVQDERHFPVLDATVEVRAGARDGPLGPPVVARTGSVANRLLYAAALRLDQPGLWQLVVGVTGKNGAGELALAVEVQPSGPPAFTAPLLLFALPSIVVVVGFLARQARLKRLERGRIVPS